MIIDNIDFAHLEAAQALGTDEARALIGVYALAILPSVKGLGYWEPQSDAMESVVGQLTEAVRQQLEAVREAA